MNYEGHDPIRVLWSLCALDDDLSDPYEEEDKEDEEDGEDEEGEKGKKGEVGTGEEPRSPERL
jgi:hypothetical protein